MFDTIRAQCEWQINSEIAKALLRAGVYRRSDWYFQRHAVESNGPRGIYQRLSGYNKDLGIYVEGFDETIDKVQCSLPRLLHGYNGRLLLNPYDLQKSQKALFSHLSDIANPIHAIIEYTRLDLVLNLLLDPKQLIIAHRNASHPWVRRETIEYENTSIRFPGTKMLFQIYCKNRELANKQGFPMPLLTKSARVELQIRGKNNVRKYYGNDEETPVSYLDFFLAYNIFRDAWCKFDSEARLKFPSLKCSLHAAIAECEAQDYKTTSGISFWKWFESSGQKPATLARVRSKITALKHKSMNFSWSDILPEHYGQKPLVDIFRTGKEVVIERPW